MSDQTMCFSIFYNLISDGLKSRDSEKKFNVYVLIKFILESIVKQSSL